MGSGYAVAISDVVIAGIQIAAADRIAEVQQETLKRKIAQTDAIARRIEARNDEMQTWWRDVFKACELDYAHKVCALPVPAVDVAAERSEVLRIYRAAFQHSTAEARECLAATCAPASCAATRDLAIDEAQALGYGLEAGLRAAEDEARMMQAERREQQVWVTNAGRRVYGSPLEALSVAADIHLHAARRAAGSFSQAQRLFGDGADKLVLALRDMPVRPIERTPTPMPEMPDLEVVRTPPPPAPEPARLYGIPDPVPMEITNLPPLQAPSKPARRMNDLEE
jgi:plasmid stability protein